LSAGDGGAYFCGWEIGLLVMRVGGERRLDIQPALFTREDEELPGGPAGAHWVYDSMFPPSLIFPKRKKMPA